MVTRILILKIAPFPETYFEVDSDGEHTYIHLQPLTQTLISPLSLAAKALDHLRMRKTKRWMQIAECRVN